MTTEHTDAPVTDVPSSEIERVFREHEQRVAAEVVEQGFGALEEQRQVVLDAGRRGAFLQVLVDRAAARIDRETLAQRVAERLDRLVGQRKLACGQQVDLVDLVGRARECRRIPLRGSSQRLGTARSTGFVVSPRATTVTPRPCGCTRRASRR